MTRTPYQRGIIKRYYKHKDALMSQKLGELVSELYLCEDSKKAERLWKRAKKALLNTGLHKNLVEDAIGRRNVEELAQVVSRLF